MSIHDPERLRVFQEAALDMIDNAYQVAVEPTPALKRFVESAGDIYSARDFRTVVIGGCRAIGHTTIINRLAYDIQSVGSKYSTLIMAPRADLARDYYLPHRRPELANKYPGIAEYSEQYFNALNQISKNWKNTGKALPVTSLETLGFSWRSWIDDQTRVMETLHPDQTIDKFDILCVDMASRLSRKEIDLIYHHFHDQVKLFVMMQ